jgi:hypothetical protein
MNRHQETTQRFRTLAEKAKREGHSFDPTPTKDYLDELAGKIIDEGFTTGDELVDALVAWFEHTIQRVAIDRFDSVDKRLHGMLGQTALVVSRERDKLSQLRQRPRLIVTTYAIGRINGEALTMDLLAGESTIPTEDNLSVTGIQAPVHREKPLLATKIYGTVEDERLRFLAYGYPNLAKEYYPDGRVESAFVPSDYATPLNAVESRKPYVEVVLGTDEVVNFLNNDSWAIAQLEAAGALAQVSAYLPDHALAQV